MNKFFYTFLFFISFLKIQSQPCIPDTTYTVPGTYPDTLKWAYANHAYDAVIDFRVLKDTTVYINNQPVYVPIDSAKIIDVEGIPVGFSYSCNPPGCLFPGDSNGCAALTGNPNPAQVGMYSLLVRVMYYFRIFNSPGQQEDTIDKYTLKICSADSNCIISGLGETALVQEIQPEQNIPNPARFFTTIPFNCDKDRKLTLLVINPLGQVVWQQIVSAHTGINYFKMDFPSLSPGIYFYFFRESPLLKRKMTVM